MCYRRHGHNEGDEPAFTQPLMYSKIKSRPTVRELYQKQLEASGELSKKESEDATASFKNRLQEAFESVKVSCPIRENHAYDHVWQGLDNPFSHAPVVTAVARERLLAVARALSTIPDGFTLNPKVARHLPTRLQAVQDHGQIDWGMAELLAFGTLLDEGTPVRLSGQDSIRGTFSHRHAVWFDTRTQERYIPLAHIGDDQARFCVYNSMLSEAGVLGFDYGYSLVEPHMLVIWEAQFGDFANGAQVIIDQFIAASLAKWQRASGLVMLLPHGYEGQGPEHSNAYLERYLALAAEDNIQVCNLTTPAQYFHALRRQIKRDFRRPLVVMAPKSLLRHQLAQSPADELSQGQFQEVLDDPEPPSRARRLILCSGKVFYDALEARWREQVEDVALVRLEQLYPLNVERLQQVIEPYLDAEELCWLQEEPKNRGAWSHIMQQLQELYPERQVRYIGRPASASPATGSLRVHRRQQEELIAAALASKPSGRSEGA
jgi:2-oxoglutarate dehydrogenase E1 component